MAKTFVKIANAGDYHAVYEDYIDFEKGFNEDCQNLISFDEFMTEFKKGYGKSDCIQIARLIETRHGIYYDNEYVQ